MINPDSGPRNSFAYLPPRNNVLRLLLTGTFRIFFFLVRLIHKGIGKSGDPMRATYILLDRNSVIAASYCEVVLNTLFARYIRVSSLRHPSALSSLSTRP